MSAFTLEVTLEVVDAWLRRPDDLLQMIEQCCGNDIARCFTRSG